jgi:hypothetical protein
VLRGLGQRRSVVGKLPVLGSDVAGGARLPDGAGFTWNVIVARFT